MTETEIIEKYDRKLSDLQDKYLDLTNESYTEPVRPMGIANNGENLIYKYSAIVEYVVNKMENNGNHLIESNIKENYECYSGDAVFVKNEATDLGHFNGLPTYKCPFCKMSFNSTCNTLFFLPSI